MNNDFCCCSVNGNVGDIKISSIGSSLILFNVDVVVEIIGGVYLLIVQENDELLLFFKGLLLLLLLKYKLLLLLMLLQFVAGVILIAPFEFLTRSNKSEADGIVDFATFEPNCIGNGDDDKDDDADADEHNDD